MQRRGNPAEQCCQIDVQMCQILTWDTGEARLQVGHHVVGTWLLLVHRLVWYLDGARPASRAARVHQRQHVCVASNVDVGARAAAVPHTAVVSRRHQHRGAGRTAGVERLELTVIDHLAGSQCN